MRPITPRKPGESDFRHDGDDFDNMNLSIAFEDHKRANDGVAALEAFVYCYEVGICPPTWVLDWLGPAMTAFLDGNGKIDLVTELGLKSRGAGIDPPLKRRVMQARDYDLAIAVWVCHELIGQSIGESAYSVMRRAQERGENPPKDTWIAESYEKRWKGLRKRFDEERKKWEEIFLPRLDTFIASFPDDAKPKGLK
ncbi:MAG: hypothetical protein R6X15_05315 [Pseudomonadota bacterium]